MFLNIFGNNAVLYSHFTLNELSEYGPMLLNPFITASISILTSTGVRRSKIIKAGIGDERDSIVDAVH